MKVRRGGDKCCHHKMRPTGEESALILEHGVPHTPSSQSCRSGGDAEEIIVPHMVTMPLWRGEPATEQEAISFVVPDEEKEGAVSTEHWNITSAAKLNDGRRSCCSLGAFFIDLHNTLVNKLGQTQVSLWRHS